MGGIVNVPPMSGVTCTMTEEDGSITPLDISNWWVWPTISNCSPDTLGKVGVRESVPRFVMVRRAVSPRVISLGSIVTYTRDSACAGDCASSMNAVAQIVRRV